MESHRRGGTEGVLVLGMHRSGTSVVAGTLHLLGLATCAPEDLITGMPWNPAGHWESRSLSRLDDRLLDEMRRAWWYPPPSGATYADVTSGLATAPETAADLFRRTYTSMPWVWKDPRLCLLLPFWREALGEAVAAVVVHRDPRGGGAVARVAQRLPDILRHGPLGAVQPAPPRTLSWARRSPGGL